MTCLLWVWGHEGKGFSSLLAFVSISLVFNIDTIHPHYDNRVRQITCEGTKMRLAIDISTLSYLCMQFHATSEQRLKTRNSFRNGYPAS